MLQNSINIQLIYNENFYTKKKDIQYNRKFKAKVWIPCDLLYRRIAKVGAKVGVKVIATSYTGLLPWLPEIHTYKDNKKCNKGYQVQHH